MSLMDDLVGDILLRIPPDEPAHLVRAALVCKPWLKVVSCPSFRRGYRERHRTPPLGFVHNLYHNFPIPRFVPTTAASPCSSPALGCPSWWALDSRHGRVLIRRFGPSDLVVWDPITEDQQHLPFPPYPHGYSTGAVLCAAAGCDHLHCTSGPFLVVFVGTDTHEDITWASVYSSEARGWSTVVITDLNTSLMVAIHSYIAMKPSILIRNALYFTLESGMALLEYDLVGQCFSVIDAPMMGIVMAAEDGVLGLALLKAQIPSF